MCDDQSTEPGDDELLSSLEAVLMVVTEPVSEDELAAGLEVSTARIVAALGTLAADYAGELPQTTGDSGTSRARGFELRRVAGGWRIYSRARHAEAVGTFLTHGQSSRLSQAALETLAVVAYRQPVTRARMAAIRGVNVDGVVRTLLMRGLIVEVGADPASGSQAFATSGLFLETMGMNSLDELPDIAPYLPEAAELNDENL